MNDDSNVMLITSYGNFGYGKITGNKFKGMMALTRSVNEPYTPLVTTPVTRGSAWINLCRVKVYE